MIYILRHQSNTWSAHAFWSLAHFSMLTCLVQSPSSSRLSIVKVSVLSNKLTSLILRWRTCTCLKTFNVKSENSWQGPRATLITKESLKSFLRLFLLLWSYKSPNKFSKTPFDDHPFSKKKMKSLSLWLHILFWCYRYQKRTSSLRILNSKLTMFTSLLKELAMFLW